jgi:hypothetical protein
MDLLLGAIHVIQLKYDSAWKMKLGREKLNDSKFGSSTGDALREPEVNKHPAEAV